MPDKASLKEEIIRLGPWFFDVEVADGLTTSVFGEAPPGTYPESFGPVGFQSTRVYYRHRLRRLYPEHRPGALQGRTVLDCACNCGAHLFWARETGAGECFGIDVREHWIRQARFLQQHRPDSDGMRFEVMDLYDLPKLGLEQFDITIFGGIFYHLPDPVTGLKIAADLTRELMILHTETGWGRDDDSLIASHESTEALMSGVYGLHWIPTRPAVVEQILRWTGFTDTVVERWFQTEPDRGRADILASKRPGLLDPYRDEPA
jgi:tRNA (mo5U34)-methyltransferase